MEGPGDGAHPIFHVEAHIILLIGLDHLGKMPEVGDGLAVELEHLHVEEVLIAKRRIACQHL